MKKINELKIMKPKKWKYSFVRVNHCKASASV